MKKLKLITRMVSISFGIGCIMLVGSLSSAAGVRGPGNFHFSCFIKAPDCGPGKVAECLGQNEWQCEDEPKCDPYAPLPQCEMDRQPLCDPSTGLMYCPKLAAQ